MAEGAAGGVVEAAGQAGNGVAGGVWDDAMFGAESEAGGAGEDPGASEAGGGESGGEAGGQGESEEKETNQQEAEGKGGEASGFEAERAAWAERLDGYEKRIAELTAKVESLGRGGESRGEPDHAEKAKAEAERAARRAEYLRGAGERLSAAVVEGKTDEIGNVIFDVASKIASAQVDAALKRHGLAGLPERVERLGSEFSAVSGDALARRAATEALNALVSDGALPVDHGLEAMDVVKAARELVAKGRKDPGAAFAAAAFAAYRGLAAKKGVEGDPKKKAALGRAGSSPGAEGNGGQKKTGALPYAEWRKAAEAAKKAAVNPFGE